MSPIAHCRFRCHSWSGRCRLRRGHSHGRRRATGGIRQVLVNAAVCGECHSPRDDQGQAIAGREFSGGEEFPLPGGGIVRTANITPEANTGIGSWTEEEFVQKFKAFAEPRRVP